MENKITCVRDHYHIKIYIDNVVHLHLDYENHDGFQSWFDGNGKDKQKVYSIEFYRKQGEPILTQYDSRKIWEDILKVLDKKI